MRIFETAFLETESTWVEARRAATEAEESGFKELAGSAEWPITIPVPHPRVDSDGTPRHLDQNIWANQNKWATEQMIYFRGFWG